MENSRLSIITVCYNAESCITQTINSVIKYATENIEYIIIDGKSKDTTMSIVNGYADIFKEKKISFKIVSERDHGIYDAMNKGISHSSGDWMMFLNCGDILINSIDISMFKEHSMYCFGFYFYFMNNNSKYRKKQFPQLLKYDLPTCHNAIIFPKSSIYYDLNYKFCADYDFYNNYLKAGYKALLINKTLIEYSRDGVSEIYLIPTFKEKLIININKYKSMNIVFYLLIIYIKAILFRFAKSFLSEKTIIKRRLKIGYTKL
jgi:glycosyltransferase involved in cell wall biosynthesis